MNTFWVFAVLAVLAVACKADVLVLTDESFDKEVENSALFIKFYAPWCGHCRNLAPTWEDLAKEYASHEKAIRIANIDCTQHGSRCQKYGIRGYPTLKLFVDGREEAYSGARNIDSFKDFIGKHINVYSEKFTDSGAAVKEDVAAETPKAHASHDQVFVGDANNFADLIKDEAFVKFYAPWCGHCKRLAPTWDELAQKTAQLTTKIVKVDCDQYGQLCQQYEVRGYPTLYYFKGGERVGDRYSGARTVEALTAFVQEQSGSAAEEEEAANAESVVIENGMRVLTDATFEEGISQKKFALVKFYAPWCGHCKRLAPAWDELAAKFADSPSALVAKVDCTIHSATCSKFSIRGYPSLLLFEDGQQVEKYSGGRDISSLSKYLSGKAGHDEL